jgi:hypothetical protein
LCRRLPRGRLRNFNQLRRPRFCCTCDQTQTNIYPDHSVGVDHDELEEQIAAAGNDRPITDLVDDQESEAAEESDKRDQAPHTVVGAFPDGQSCLNLAAARLRHIA